MKNYSLSFIFFCCCYSVAICTEPCLPAPRKLDLFALQVSCQGTEGLPDLPCEKAIDEDLNSLWHPINQHQKFYKLSWKPMIRLTQIRILQYNWEHGRARKLRLSINGHEMWANLRRRKDDWDRVTLPFTILTNHISIEVKEVDQLLFGGFKEIQLFGCDQKINPDQGWPPTTWPPLIITTSYQVVKSIFLQLNYF